MSQSGISSRRFFRIGRALLWVIGGLVFAAGLSLLLVLRFDGVHSRAAKEASVVSKLLTVINLQKEYNAAHPDAGFACELPLLKPIGQQQYSDYSLECLTTGKQSGYSFALVSCGSDTNRPRNRYQVTAVPIEYGATGLRAFCADETGAIWYNLEGSGTKCLASRKLLK